MIFIMATSNLAIWYRLTTYTVYSKLVDNPKEWWRLFSALSEFNKLWICDIFLLQQEIQSLREKLRKQKSSTDVVAAEQVRTRNVIVTEKVWSVICSPQKLFKYIYLVY